MESARLVVDLFSRLSLIDILPSSFLPARARARQSNSFDAMPPDLAGDDSLDGDKDKEKEKRGSGSGAAGEDQGWNGTRNTTPSITFSKEVVVGSKKVVRSHPLRCMTSCPFEL